MTLLAWLRARWRSLFGARDSAEPRTLPAAVSQSQTDDSARVMSDARLPERDARAEKLERRLHAAESREADGRKRAAVVEARAKEAEDRVRALEEAARHAEHDARSKVDDEARTAQRIKDLEARLATARERLHETEALLKDAEAMVRSNPPRTESADSPAHAGVAEAHFSPGETCIQAIRGQFARAKHTVDVCVFTITDDRIAGFVLDAHRRGVKVRIITDNDKALDEGSDIGRLARAGVPVRQDLTEYHMHHKFAVFDRKVMLTGSYNWTRGAANFNAENIVVTDEPRLLAAFGAQFEALWSKYAPQ